jgi:hypothetical protein
MPTPLKPAKDMQDGSLGNIFNDPYKNTPLSKEERTVINPEKKKIKASAKSKFVSQRTKELLFQAWKNKDNDPVVLAQKSFNKEDEVYKLSNEVPFYDVYKMAQEGAVIHKGNRIVALTDVGKFVLGKEIMSQQNEFLKNRKKDKFVFSQSALPGNVINTINEESERLQNEYEEDLMREMEEAQDVAAENAANDASTELADAIGDAIGENFEEIEIEPEKLIAKNKVKKYITAALCQANPEKHGDLIEKLNDMYVNLEEGVMEPQKLLKYFED